MLHHVISRVFTRVLRVFTSFWLDRLGRDVLMLVFAINYVFWSFLTLFTRLCVVLFCFARFSIILLVDTLLATIKT